MIKYIEIENFRTIQKLSIDPISRITLFSGKNNIGKSTILEALFLMRAHLDSNVFYNLDMFRGVDLASGYGTEIWEPIFYNYELNNTVKIKTLTVENSEESLCFSKDTAYVPGVEKQIPPETMSMFRAAARQYYTLKFAYKNGDYEENGHYSIAQSGTLRQMKTSLSDNEVLSPESTFFLNPLSTRNISTLVADQIGKFIIRGDKDRIIKALSYIQPDIEDILTLSVHGRVQIYIKTNKQTFPIQYAGDGMVKLLNIIVTIMSNQNSLVLIDEIDAGFHYSMYETLWRVINEASLLSHCQVIATTHSYECISKFRSGLRKNSEDATYIRLGHDQKGLKAFAYDYDVLTTALNSEMEIR